jgi:membrane protein
MYAGLASAMVALIFLYVCASIFIYGGELNSVIAKASAKARKSTRKKINRRR